MSTEPHKLSKAEARKKFWADKTPQERSEHARKMANDRYKGMDFETKRAHALKMVEARRQKRVADKVEDTNTNQTQE